MKNKNDKIVSLLSLIRKCRGYLTIFERDESGNKVEISKEPFDSDFDCEIELIYTGHSPASSEEEIED